MYKSIGFDTNNHNEAMCKCCDCILTMIDITESFECIEKVFIMKHK